MSDAKEEKVILTVESDSVEFMEKIGERNKIDSKKLMSTIINSYAFNFLDADELPTTEATPTGADVLTSEVALLLESDSVEFMNRLGSHSNVETKDLMVGLIHTYVAHYRDE